MTNILSTYKYRYLFVYFLLDFMIYQLKTGSLTFSPMLYIVYGNILKEKIIDKGTCSERR